jgi:hypothetical protein
MTAVFAKRRRYLRNDGGFCRTMAVLTKFQLLNSCEEKEKLASASPSHITRIHLKSNSFIP